MSQTATALTNLSRTLLDRARMAGDREVNRANADLAKTQLDYTLARNREADQLAKERWDLQRPGMQVEAEQNRSQLERWKKPLTVGNVFGGTHGSEIAVFSKPGEPQRNANVYQFGRNVFSAEYDDEGGVWVKPDGSVVTEGDLELNKDKAAAWVDSVHDVHKMFNEKAMRLKDLLDANKIKKEDYDKGIAALTDPQTRYNELSKQLERVNQWAPMLPGIAAEKKAKIQNDMAALQNAMAEKANAQAKMAWEREKLNVEQAGLNARAAKEFYNPKTGQTVLVGPGQGVPDGFIPVSIAKEQISSASKTDKPINLSPAAINSMYPVPTDLSGTPEPTHSAANSSIQRLVPFATNEEKQILVTALPVIQRRVDALRAAGKTADGRPITPEIIDQVVRGTIAEAMSGGAAKPAQPQGKPAYPGGTSKGAADTKGAAPRREKFPDVRPVVSSIKPEEIETPGPARTPMEAVTSKQYPGRDIVDWASQNQPDKYRKFGEGPVEMALRQVGFDSWSIGKRQEKANELRAKYPNATDEQIAKAIVAGIEQENTTKRRGELERAAKISGVR